MKIQMIAGPRNEELIAKMKELRENDYDEMYDYFDELICDYGESVAYDTLYYACEDGDEMLASQTAYFEYMLFNDEREYYVERMLHDLTRKEWLENTISDAENAIGEGRGFAAKYRIEYSGIRADKHIIFAINRHEDGWKYFVLDSKYRSIEDGIYDNPDMPIGEVLRILFEEFDIPGHEHIEKIVDYDEVIARYETQMRQNEYTCWICGKPSYGYGDNPDPVNIETGARCCDICNYGMVLPARIERMKAGLPMRLVNWMTPEYINSHAPAYSYLLRYFLPELSDPHFQQEAAQEIEQDERMTYCRYMAAWLPYQPHYQEIIRTILSKESSASTPCS